MQVRIVASHLRGDGVGFTPVKCRLRLKRASWSRSPHWLSGSVGNVVAFGRLRRGFEFRHSYKSIEILSHNMSKHRGKRLVLCVRVHDKLDLTDRDRALGPSRDDVGGNKYRRW